MIVRDLDAGAVLDCSELEAEEVLVIGKIDGGSRLTLRAPGGSIVFRYGMRVEKKEEEG